MMNIKIKTLAIPAFIALSLLFTGCAGEQVETPPADDAAGQVQEGAEGAATDVQEGAEDMQEGAEDAAGDVQEGAEGAAEDAQDAVGQ